MLNLTKEESNIFFTVIDSELKSVVNEYDSNTGRRPSKKRMEEGHYAKSIMDKWMLTQNLIPNTTFINLDAICACVLDLSAGEVNYCKRLTEKYIVNIKKELTNYSKPYMGVIKQLDDMRIIAEKLIKKFKA